MEVVGGPCLPEVGRRDRASRAWGSGPGVPSLSWRPGRKDSWVGGGGRPIPAVFSNSRTRGPTWSGRLALERRGQAPRSPGPANWTDPPGLTHSRTTDDEDLHGPY